MVLGITKLLAIVTIISSLEAIDGSIDVTDIRAFEFFWSRQVKSIREACDRPPGNFLRLLKFAIDHTEDCQKTMADWLYLKETGQLLIEPKDFRKIRDDDKVKAAANCWHNILIHMEACYKSTSDLDRARIYLFPNFISSLYFENGIWLLPDLPLSIHHVPCIAEKAKPGLLRSIGNHEYENDKEFLMRTDLCWMIKAEWQCCYMSENTSVELYELYYTADVTMDKIFRCGRIFTIYNRVKEIRAMLNKW